MNGVEPEGLEGRESGRGFGRVGDLLGVLRAFHGGDFSARLPLDQVGTAHEIAVAVNDVIELAERMAHELGRINTLVAVEGRLGQRMSLGDVRGGWLSCVESVNGLIADLVQPTAEVGEHAHGSDGEIEIVLDRRRRVRLRGRVDAQWLGDVLRTVETLGC